MKISCHKHNLKPGLLQYIYPISYKNAKKGKSPKKDLPYWKTISQVLNRLLGLQIYSRYQRFGVDDFISKSSKIWPSYFDAEYRLPLLHHIGDLKDLQLQPSLQMGIAASILIR
jgi:hypothetical protein